ncbi:MAG: tail fiber protein [Prevotellaceae bacterium]|jgi:microcystin-dependent protein|nr:tail fiber protein [Prevotellaceae bacterium]
MNEIQKILGNFLTQPNNDFPLDCETLDYLQKNEAILAIIGNIAGNKTILLGCELTNNNTSRNPGFVFLQTVDFSNGEILYFEGGAVASGMYMKKEAISVTAQNVAYPQAYIKRSLAAGIGSEQYSWNDFKTLTTNAQLAEKNVEQDNAIAALAPPPLGIVQMWAGGVDAQSMPENYMLCNGTELLSTEYPALYAKIGRIHTPTTVAQGRFRLPDLRSRFITGYNSDETDYNAIAKTGGEKAHQLSISEIPSHAHAVNDYYYIESVSKIGNGTGFSGKEINPTNGIGSNSTDSDNTVLLYKTHNSQNAGGGATHENRPPYYVLAFIIRVK